MKTIVKKIIGNWDLGFTLDKHMLSSTAIGEDQYGHMQFDNKRSEIGGKRPTEPSTLIL